MTVAPKDLAAVADSVAAAALSVPGVSRLHGGSFGEVATYLAGRQVEGGYAMACSRCISRS